MLSMCSLLPALALSATLSEGPRPPLDAFLDQQDLRAVLSAAALPADLALRVRAGRVSAVEPRLGVPTFFWAARAPGARGLRAVGLSPEQAARRHLFAHAPLYRAEPAALADAKLKGLHDTGAGAIIATFTGEAGGVRVFRDELKVIMDRDLNLVALSGYLSPRTRALGAFNLHERTALAVAYEDLVGAPLEASALREVFAADAQAGYRRFALPGQAAPARTRKVYFPLAQGLEPGFYVELDVGAADSTDSEVYAWVVSARDGRLLYRKNLEVADAYSYRVWADAAAPHRPFDGPQGVQATPHPTGLPDAWAAPFVAPNLVTLANSPFSRNDPWLLATATTTSGNNASAYGDTTSPNGFNAADLQPALSGARAFDHTYDPALGPGASTQQRSAAVTQLFFDVNFFHDWYYDDGFDEAAGNAQQSNFGRGGIGGDPLTAEGQDYSGRNNADMSTPSDGARPRMQMYVFDGGRASAVRLNAATPLDYASGVAAFGPQTFDVTGTLVVADDGADPKADGCQPISNVAGAIALVDRGTCTFAEKAQAAQSAGAIGVIIANNTYGGAFPVSGASASVTIPVLSVGRADGVALKAAAQAGTASVNLNRVAVIDRDGTIDNAIVAHEWGHYISNRLIGDGNGISSQQAVGMGEGWGDFHALLLVVREGDDAVAANALWSGVYGLAAYTSQGLDPRGYYWGIRRVPYSTDFGKNALTFKHITNGVALPPGVPTNGALGGADNAEVHNTGEVWATMLWEAYAALLKDQGRLTFAEAQRRMKAYLVAGYKATPLMPTFVEARDALLSVAAARDVNDFALMSAAFARRGLGMKAVAPARDSQTNAGVVESFLSGNDVDVVSVTLDDSVAGCDHDGVLDRDETGRLEVTLKNVGAGALSATTVRVSSSTPGVSIGAGGQVTVPAFAPFATATAALPVTLTGTTGVQSVVLQLEVDDPSLAVTRPVRVAVAFRGNADVRPAGSALDDVEAPTSLWTVSAAPNLNTSSGWRRYEAAPTSHHWFGPNPASPADTYLVSPLLEVGAAGNFGFTFLHRYEFEADPDANYDGGVLELSTDGGLTWTDVGARVTPGYPGTLSGQGSNPLKGRAAFVGKSPNYPAFEPASVDLGLAFAGKTVRVRFRIGSDDAAGAKGWEVDDLRFLGLAAKPFPQTVVDPNLCTNRRPLVSAAPPLTVAEGAEVTLANAASDPDGDPVTVGYEQVSGPVVALSGARFTAPLVDADAELSFEARAFDGRAESLPVIQLVRVLNVNQRPVAIVPSSAQVRSTELLTLEGQGADPDGDALTFAWTQVEGPAVALHQADQARVTFLGPVAYAAGTITLALTVSDGREVSAPVEVEVALVPLKPAGGAPPWHPRASGCGCALGAEGAAAWPGALLLLALRGRRRRRA